MGRYISMFNGMPRAMQWGLCAVVGILLYFLAIEPAIDRIGAWSGNADTHEAMLRSFTTQEGTVQKAVETIELGQRHFGDVDFVGDDSTRPLQFNDAVNKVLKDNKISNAKTRDKYSPLAQGILTAKMGSEVRVQRVTRDIEFDAAPEAVAAVVADLERSPVVASVSRVQVRVAENKEGGERIVHATLTAEAWVSGRKGQGER